ncbi:hypothetical protein L3C95_00270 [Chitinophaga filiformis]|uniref:hypothetical protein n=1 Tax=Chitinophaga filiformis TaxID=104663 RepID=UPI001F36692B|nr:hypothetical protein [Chitinophaga filiformis]MCF6401287.1 hypothetical protein [Chitinophaga filiformis]
MKDKKDNISNIEESRQRLDQDDTVDKELNSHNTLTSSTVKKTSEAKIIRMDTDAYLYRSILNRRME